MTVRIQSLGSGSSGNALLVRGASLSILVDCGLAPRELKAILAAARCTVDEIGLVLLTHEHGDHTRSLPAIAAGGCPIMATSGTLAALGVPEARRVQADAGKDVTFGAMTARALPVSHDAAEPCGFLISLEGVRCTVLTDLGRPAPEHSGAIRSSDLVVIEANHDAARLRSGPYPARLKQRVTSALGHLSNDECGRWLAEALSGSSTSPDVWLAHLSRVNNLPVLARETVEQRLRETGVTAPVTPLPRRASGPAWDGPTCRGHLLDAPLQLSLSLS